MTFKLPSKESGDKMLLESFFWVIGILSIYISVIITSTFSCDGAHEAPTASNASTLTPSPLVSTITLAPTPRPAPLAVCLGASFAPQQLFATLIAWGIEVIGTALIELVALWDAEELRCCFRSCFERRGDIVEFCRAGFSLIMTVAGLCLWGNSGGGAVAAIGANMVAAAGTGLLYFLLEVLHRKPGKVWGVSWVCFKCIYFLPLVIMGVISTKTAVEENSILCVGLFLLGVGLVVCCTAILVYHGHAPKEHVSETRVRPDVVDPPVPTLIDVAPEGRMRSRSDSFHSCNSTGSSTFKYETD